MGDINGTTTVHNALSNSTYSLCLGLTWMVRIPWDTNSHPLMAQMPPSCYYNCFWEVACSQHLKIRKAPQGGCGLSSDPIGTLLEHLGAPQHHLKLSLSPPEGHPKVAESARKYPKVKSTQETKNIVAVSGSRRGD